jgi:hypothetical protein
VFEGYVAALYLGREVRAEQALADVPRRIEENPRTPRATGVLTGRSVSRWLLALVALGDCSAHATSALPRFVGHVPSLGLLMSVSFSHPEARMDHWMSRGMRSIMLRNDAYLICDDAEVAARRYPPLTMEASVLRDALEIM